MWVINNDYGSSGTAGNKRCVSLAVSMYTAGVATKHVALSMGAGFMQLWSLDGVVLNTSHDCGLSVL